MTRTKRTNACIATVAGCLVLLLTTAPAGLAGSPTKGALPVPHALEQASEQLGDRVESCNLEPLESPVSFDGWYVRGEDHEFSEARRNGEPVDVATWDDQLRDAYTGTQGQDESHAFLATMERILARCEGGFGGCIAFEMVKTLAGLTIRAEFCGVCCGKYGLPELSCSTAHESAVCRCNELTQH